MTSLTQNLSAPVVSSQLQAHPQLVQVVQRHKESPWQHKPHRPTQLAFQQLRELIAGEGDRPMILDSGCGTGQSTLSIATAFPQCLVVGIDQSIKRLQRTGAGSFPHQQGNTVWIRAELASFWWLAERAGWRLFRHYILYPNPWPKPCQLRHRWHGHPVFPTMLALGGVLELRCNWKVYAQEFALALRQLKGVPADADRLLKNEAISPFEKKYRDSGLPLFQVLADLDS